MHVSELLTAIVSYSWSRPSVPENFLYFLKAKAFNASFTLAVVV